MNYNKEVISRLTELIKGNDTARGWLQKNNFPELILLHYSFIGHDDALKKVSDKEHFDVVAFAHAVRGDKKALKWLLENKKTEWAATANLINQDKKAEAWLRNYKLYHYIELAKAIKENTDIVEDDDIFRTIARSFRMLIVGFFRMLRKK